jgi:2-polyprenyl-3-methyl-5-hydroxy-6-metoxy-1,4-benzoquinol methylase
VIKKILPTRITDSMHKINLMRLERKYKGDRGYDVKRFWDDLHTKFKSDLRSVGRYRDLDKDIAVYANSKQIFIRLCSKAGIDFKKSKVLEIGCGNGYWASVVAELGCLDYMGFDISDFAIKMAAGRFPSYKFQCFDVSEKKIQDKYDVIMMIDVTQHIVKKDKFMYAMQNIKNATKKDGYIILTSYLQDKPEHYNFFCVPWHLEDYQTVFQKDSTRFTIEDGFNEKQIFVIELK